MSEEATPKVGQERSPRFPSDTLKDSIESIEKLYTGLGRSSAPAEAVAKAIGYTGLNGASRTTLAALAYYGLLAREGNNQRVSELALRIIRPVSDSDKAAAVRQAHLEPKLFAQIQQDNADCTEPVLATLLIHKGFTEDGAKKAARVFKDNLEFLAQFAQFGGQTNTPDATPKSPTPAAPAPAPATVQKTTMVATSMTVTANELPVPIGENLIARVPFPMSEEDFSLFIDTLNLWKRKLVKKAEEKKAEAPTS